MKKETIENVINQVIDEVEQSDEFKATFKRYIINKFSDNTTADDLRTILKLLQVEGDDE